MSLSITFQGADALREKLKGLTRAVEKRLVGRAAQAALKPLVATARKGVPIGTGNLKKSIGVKRVRKTRKGEHVLLVGARAGFKWAYGGGSVENDPVRYANPVEFGHVTPGGGFVPPAGFLRNAYNQHRVTVVDHFALELEQRIEQYLRRGA